MVCNLTWDGVNILVKEVYRRKSGLDVVQKTKLGGLPPEGLGLTPAAQRTFFGFIRKELNDGCREVFDASGIESKDFEKNTVGDIVNMIRTALNISRES
jgi:hypothetical protein